MNKYCIENNLDTATLNSIAHKPYNNDGSLRFHKGYRAEECTVSGDPIIHLSNGPSCRQKDQII